MDLESRMLTTLQMGKGFFPLLIPKESAYFHVLQLAQLGFFLPPYAEAGIRTYVSRVAL